MKKTLLTAAFSGALLFCFGQPSNDDCSNAERLCAGQPSSGTTTGATSNGTSDHNFCYSPSSTVWYLFTTDADGGDATISFTNLVFNTDPTYGQEIQVIIYNVTNPCVATSYTPYSACGTGSTDFTVNSAVALDPNTTYYVQVNGKNTGAGVTNPAECDFDIEISGTALEYTPPSATLSATQTTLCQGEDGQVSLEITGCSDTASIDWYYDNVLMSSGASSEFETTTLTDGGYLKAIINCGSLCIYSDTTDSILFDVTAIDVDAGTNKFIADGDQVMLEGSGTGTPEWSPGSSLSSTTDFQPIATPDITTTYFLTVTNGSCTLTDTVTVYVGEVITIYSSFTPNGDNINDKWIIGNSAQYPDMQVTVYDRSGQKVFQSTGYSSDEDWWDGTIMNNGKELPSSTYFYVIDLRTGEDGIFKGPVTIIR